MRTRTPHVEIPVLVPLNEAELAEVDDDLTPLVSGPVPVVTLGRTRHRLPRALVVLAAMAAFAGVANAASSGNVATTRLTHSDTSASASMASAVAPTGECFGSADAAERWLTTRAGSTCVTATSGGSCFGSADAAEHWFTHDRMLRAC